MQNGPFGTRKLTAEACGGGNGEADPTDGIIPWYNSENAPVGRIWPHLYHSIVPSSSVGPIPIPGFKLVKFVRMSALLIR